MPNNQELSRNPVCLETSCQTGNNYPDVVAGMNDVGGVFFSAGNGLDECSFSSTCGILNIYFS